MIPEIEFPPVTLEMLKRYADASGDQNPIHQDEVIAKKMGLPGVIAHGMLIAAWIARRGMDHMRAQGMNDWKLVKVRNRFKAMVQLGDRVQIGGTLTDRAPDEKVISLKAVRRGEVAATGEMVFRKDHS